MVMVSLHNKKYPNLDIVSGEASSWWFVQGTFGKNAIARIRFGNADLSISSFSPLFTHKEPVEVYSVSCVVHYSYRTGLLTFVLIENIIFIIYAAFKYVGIHLNLIFQNCTVKKRYLT